MPASASAASALLKVMKYVLSHNYSPMYINQTQYKTPGNVCFARIVITFFDSFLASNLVIGEPDAVNSTGHGGHG